MRNLNIHLFVLYLAPLYRKRYRNKNHQKYTITHSITHGCVISEHRLYVTATTDRAINNYLTAIIIHEPKYRMTRLAYRYISSMIASFITAFCTLFDDTKV
jgi:hypothetical protein